MTIIKSIELPEMFNIYTDAKGEPLKFLKPTSGINIFVGSNNSGKSLFMRMLSSQGQYKAEFAEIDLDQINIQIDAILNKIKTALVSHGFKKANKLSEESIDGLKPLPSSLSLTNDSYRSLRNTFTKWSDFPEILEWEEKMGAGNRAKNNRGELRSLVRQYSSEALQILERVPTQSEFSSPKSVYIPVLRGLRPLNNSLADLYAERTTQDYFSSDSGITVHIPEIFTGLSFYQQLTDLLLGNNRERKTISSYQDFISENLFENRPVTLIPNQQSKIAFAKIGSEQDRPIFDLGDGIQSAIILSFLPYITEEPTFFFIEEPEMYLHPGLQRKILSFFASLNRHLFFLTTHSNHFLDLTIDIKDVSIFTFRKYLSKDDEDDEQTPTFTIEVVDSGENSSLELLGVRKSSVFLVNATIWVEGITDRWYLRAMLNSYVDHLSQVGSPILKIEEDVHYSFVEYGGANITHWSFLEYEDHPIEVERLCARALVIVDKDGNAKLQRKEALSETLGDRLIVLPGREIENLLPYDVIKQVVLEYERTPDRQLPRIKDSSYQDEYLGKFIEDKILKGEFSRKGGYKATSGTLKSKVGFCKKALPKINYIDLPSYTQTIVERIYDFIRSQNI